ncbi:MAG: PfkB family carbohydrate kinase, partial [Paracoccaceae bacterium]
MRDILITGLTTLDLIFKMENFPNKNEKYRADTAMLSGGGNAGNASVAVARLGANSTIFSAVGKDDVGSLILAKLQRESVNTEFVLTIENWQSSFSSVFVDINGERQIMNYRNSLPEGAAKSILGFPVYDAYLSDSRWNEAAIATLSLAKKFKKPGILDAEAPVSDQAV